MAKIKSVYTEKEIDDIHLGRLAVIGQEYKCTNGKVYYGYGNDFRLRLKESNLPNLPPNGNGSTFLADNGTFVTPSGTGIQSVIPIYPITSTGGVNPKIGIDLIKFYFKYIFHYDAGTFLNPNKNSPINAGTFLLPSVNMLYDFGTF